MEVVKLLLTIAIGYVLGSVSTAIIAGNIFGVNITKKGSGSAGLTNALRVLGPKGAAIVLVGDVLKTFLACYVGFLLNRDFVGTTKFIDPEDANLGMILGGVSCMIGHIWPVFFGFKGGKGVLCSAVVALLMDYKIAIILLCVFVVIALVSRYVSLASIIAGIGFPVASFALDKQPLYFKVYAIIIAVLIVIMHRKNIGRLASGTENKLSFHSGG